MLENYSEPHLNLFCCPFAGGSYYSYYPLSQAFAPQFNTIALDLPGHGRRLNEPLLEHMTAMSADLFLQIKEMLHEPYAIYGHSMGATLGYLLVRRILEEGLPKPLALFVSSRPAPTVPPEEKKAHLLPKHEFLDHLISYGGIQPQVLKEPDVLDLFEPILRADFKAIATYSHTAGPPLPIPINVFVGMDDTTTYAQALKWGEVSQYPLKIDQFPGNHFFFLDYLETLKNIFLNRIGHHIQERRHR